MKSNKQAGEKITEKPKIIRNPYTPKEWETIFQNVERTMKEDAEKEAETRQKLQKTYTPEVWKGIGERASNRAKESKPGFDVDEYWQKYGKEIDRRMLERKLESFSKELEGYKKNLRLKCPYLCSATLRNLEILTSQAQDLLKRSEDLPSLPQKYQERIRDLTNDIRGTISDVAVKAEEHSKTKGINPEYATFFRRIGQDAEFCLEKLKLIIPNEITITKIEDKIKELYPKLTIN